MLALSANPDFKTYGKYKVEDPFRDMNGDDLSHKTEVYGTDAIDQAIEAVIVTEPWERINNPDFWSPFYKLLFENSANADSIIEEVFQKIELFCNVEVDRDNANVNVDSFEHEVSLQIPYWFGPNNKYHIFSRVISK